MNRIYIIMEDCGNFDPYGGGKESAEPIDFCDTLIEAEDLCAKYEQNDAGNYYYWREVIKGGD